MSEYADLCPVGDTDIFVAATLKLIEDVKSHADYRRENPLSEPGQIEKELKRVRKTLSGLSNEARTELLIREGKARGKDIGHFLLNKDESALLMLHYTAEEGYKRPWRQDRSTRMNLIIRAENIFMSCNKVRPIRLNADQSFVLYIEMLIEDCGLGGDGGIDAERLIRDYHSFQKIREAEQGF